MHKAGFVNIIGKPNVGKSSLLNKLIGEKLAAVTYKAQTTRHRIFGILNTDDYQLIISDTPGLLKPAYTMQEGMMTHVNESLLDADVFLIMTDVTDKFDFEKIIEKISNTNKPIIVAVNKCDLSTQEHINNIMLSWQEKLPKAEIIPISVLETFNLNKLLEAVLVHIPEHEPYFSKEDVSNLPIRFFTSEIIREKIFLNYEKEIPYSVEVVVDTFEDGKTLAKIRALIYVERQSQKGIIIGKGGEALKKVGTHARKDIEKLIDKKVFLELHVKVQKNWRTDKIQLKKFGLWN